MKTFASLLILMTLTVSAVAETNAAFVNMKTIFGEFYKTKDQDAALKTQREVAKEYTERMKQDIIKLRDEYEKLTKYAQNPVLNPQARNKMHEEAKDKETAILMKDKHIRKFMTERRKEMEQKYIKSRDGIVKEIREEISSFAEKAKYDLVIDISGESANMVPVVVFYNPKKDITQVILKRLNAGHESVTEEKKTSDK